MKPINNWTDMINSIYKIHIKLNFIANNALSFINKTYIEKEKKYGPY